MGMFGQKMRMTGFQLRYPRTSRTLELQIENLPIYVCFLRSEHAGSGKTQFHPVSCRLLRRDLIARPIRLEQYSDTKTPATPSKTEQTLRRRYSDTTDSQFASSVMTSRRQLGIRKRQRDPKNQKLSTTSSRSTQPHAPPTHVITLTALQQPLHEQTDPPPHVLTLIAPQQPLHEQTNPIDGKHSRTTPHHG